MSARPSVRPVDPEDIEALPTVRERRWGRLPRYPERLSGLSRDIVDRLTRPSKFNDFNPPVVSRVVSITGTKRGVRLIDLDSLDAYIEKQSASSKEPWARAPKKPTNPKSCRRKTSKSKT